MSDEDCETREGDRRRHCELVIKQEQWAKDFEYRYTSNEEKASDWREKTLMRIDTLTESVSTLTRPYKLLMWILSAVTLLWLVDVFEFVKKIITENIK